MKGYIYQGRLGRIMLMEDSKEPQSKIELRIQSRGGWKALKKQRQEAIRETKSIKATKVNIDYNTTQ